MAADWGRAINEGVKVMRDRGVPARPIDYWLPKDIDTETKARILDGLPPSGYAYPIIGPTSEEEMFYADPVHGVHTRVSLELCFVVSERQNVTAVAIFTRKSWYYDGNARKRIGTTKTYFYGDPGSLVMSLTGERYLLTEHFGDDGIPHPSTVDPYITVVNLDPWLYQNMENTMQKRKGFSLRVLIAAYTKRKMSQWLAYYHKLEHRR